MVLVTTARDFLIWAVLFEYQDRIKTCFFLIWPKTNQPGFTSPGVWLLSPMQHPIGIFWCCHKAPTYFSEEDIMGSDSVVDGDVTMGIEGKYVGVMFPPHFHTKDGYGSNKSVVTERSMWNFQKWFPNWRNNSSGFLKVTMGFSHGILKVMVVSDLDDLGSGYQVGVAASSWCSSPEDSANSTWDITIFTR